MNFNKIVYSFIKAASERWIFPMRYDPNVNVVKAALVSTRRSIADYLAHAGAARTSPEQANMREIMN